MTTFKPGDRVVWSHDHVGLPVTDGIVTRTDAERVHVRWEGGRDGIYTMDVAQVYLVLAENPAPPNDQPGEVLS